VGGAVMIIQALIVAYFFNGISRNMLKVIPEVEEDIDNAIKDQYEIVRLNALLQEEKTKGELHFLKALINFGAIGFILNNNIL
jgi:hypothetical protein